MYSAGTGKGSLEPLTYLDSAIQYVSICAKAIRASILVHIHSQSMRGIDSTIHEVSQIIIIFLNNQLFAPYN